MSYQSFIDAYSNVNFDAFPWGMPNHYSIQGVETKEIHPPTVNVDSVEDQEPEYRDPHLNFHIHAQSIQPNPHATAAIVPSFSNNDARQYAHSGAPLAPNVQPGG